MARRRRGRRWIKTAIKRPGALRAAARRAGAMTRSGTIRRSWLQAQAKRPGRRGRQARLALRMRGFRRRGRRRRR